VKIRIKQGFGFYKPGQEFDWARGMARVMIARGLIEEIKEPESPPPLEVEEAVAPEPPLERAVERHPRKQKR
jgi:hypothetical protein